MELFTLHQSPRKDTTAGSSGKCCPGTAVRDFGCGGQDTGVTVLGEGPFTVIYRLPVCINGLDNTHPGRGEQSEMFEMIPLLPGGLAGAHLHGRHGAGDARGRGDGPGTAHQGRAGRGRRARPPAQRHLHRRDGHRQGPQRVLHRCVSILGPVWRRRCARSDPLLWDRNQSELRDCNAPQSAPVAFAPQASLSCKSAGRRLRPNLG